ncbi:MAG: gamma-glutamylcyclotransferase family protein [Solirubrobacteraceae bacterium]
MNGLPLHDGTLDNPCDVDLDERTSLTASLGPALSAQLFPVAAWTSADPSRFPRASLSRLAAERLVAPRCAGRLHGLDPAGRGWVDRLTGEVIQLAGRLMIRGYGSNLNPAKLADRFAGEGVFALRAAVVGSAAAWCADRRGSGDVVATLVHAPARVEVHALLALTEAQLLQMDRWEGHPHYYRRQPFRGAVLLEDRTLMAGSASQDAIQVYVGCPGVRSPLLVNGRPLLLADVSYELVDSIVTGRART